MINIFSTSTFYNKKFFISTFLLIILILNLFLFKDVYEEQSISILFLEKIHSIPKDISKIFKILYFFSLIISWSFFLNIIYQKFIIPTIPEKTKTNIQEKNSLIIGKNLSDGKIVSIPEKGLYQNILITGTIGTGKTSSAMYPITKQLLNMGIGMLVLDVKGNFHEKVKELSANTNKKLIVIQLGGKYTYNPLDKPNLKPSILANRIKTILTLFSNQNTTDSYWLDKVELYLTECIKLCRLYNDNYVTFIELHKLINDSKYLEDKISIVKNLFLSNSLNQSQVYDFKTSLEFFTSEFKSLDSRVLSIIQSEVSRITQLFVSDYEVAKTFCPDKANISFSVFENLEDNIVVLNMNIAEYRNLSKIIATYLKLDFQSEVLMRLAKKNTIKPVAFVCDEYHEYATQNDADFFSESREAKCINIVSTQSYTSLLNAVRENSAAKIIIQSLVNKIWFRTDDIFTIEEAQKQLGKEDKTKYSHTISENAKETKFNYILNNFKSSNSNISESISSQIHHDFIYDINTFSRELRTFEAICFLSNGYEILKPQILQLTPKFKANKFI